MKNYIIRHSLENNKPVWEIGYTEVYQNNIMVGNPAKAQLWNQEYFSTVAKYSSEKEARRALAHIMKPDIE